MGSLILRIRMGQRSTAEFGGTLPAVVGPFAVRVGSERWPVKYTGTLFQDLQRMVDIYLEWNARICVVCHQRYSEHSPIGAYCPGGMSTDPEYMRTIFSEEICESAVAMKIPARIPASTR